MAARENQGYLIAVIILVLITLVLALSTFLGISKASEYADAKSNAELELLVQTKMKTAHEIESSYLRAIVGQLGVTVAEMPTLLDSLDNLRNDPKLTDAQKTQISNIVDNVLEVRDGYEKDMKRFIASKSGDEQVVDQTYRSLASNLGAVLATKHNAVNILNNEINRIRRTSNADVAAAEKTVEETQRLFVDKDAELDSEVSRNSAKELELNTALEDITIKNQVVVRSLEDTQDKLTTTTTQKNAEIAELKVERTTLKEKLDKFQQEDFDLHDGKIVRVAHKINKVYVNLGTSDGLRRNLSFAVYDMSVSNFEKDRHKAMIEITKVTGPHQAEARITKMNPLDPILPEDLILTATWDPGYKVPIALIGLFDIDGDGQSDRLQLVQMIENNGGEVVAMHDEDGNIIGKIDSATRYAVIGEAPLPGTTRATNVYKAMRDLTKQTEKSTVQQIDERKLFEWMGVHKAAIIQRMDREIGSEHRRRRPASLKSSDR